MKRQQSSIDRLPEDIKVALQELLRDPRCTQLEAVERINQIIAGAAPVGAVREPPLREPPVREPPLREPSLHESPLQPLSKSAVNRYAVRMEQVGAKLRQSREVASMWIGKLGNEPQGEVGKLLNEMVRNLAFDTVVKMSEEDELVEPRMIKDLSIAIEKLEKATSENLKRDQEVRRQAMADAADKVADVAKQEGVSAETIQRIRRDVLMMAG